MTRSFAGHRRARKWMIGSVMALSCAQPPVVGKRPQLDIKARDIYAEDWNTTLPEGVVANPDAFRASLMQYADTTPYAATGGPSYVRLRAGKDCGDCVISVRIRTLGNTRAIDPDRPPHPGRPLAHIKNLDATITEAYYGLKPGSDADYFLWVDRRSDRPDSARLTVIELPHRAGLSVRAGRQKNLVLCNRYPHDSGASQGADFVEYRHPEGCSYPSPYRGVARYDRASMLSADVLSNVLARFVDLVRNAYMISGGGWIDCNSGCCT